MPNESQVFRVISGTTDKSPTADVALVGEDGEAWAPNPSDLGQPGGPVGPAVATGSIVYGTNLEGAQTPIPYASAPGAFALVMWDITGNFTVNAPAADGNPTTKLYVDNSVGSRVPGTSQANMLYGTNGTGIYELYPLGTFVQVGPVNQSIAGVKTFDSVPKANGTPADPTDLTPKSYVDGRTAGATTSVPGVVAQSVAQANSVAADVAALVTDFNALLAKMRTAGQLAT